MRWMWRAGSPRAASCWSMCAMFLQRAARLVAAASFLLCAFVVPAAAQKERVLNVFNWSDYVDPAVLEAFSKETGIKVRYDTFDSNDTLEVKLLTGKSGYD